MHGRPRIAIGPMDPAGTAAALAQGLRACGADAEVVVSFAHDFGYPADRVATRAGRLSYALTVALRRDVVHLQFGWSWLPRFVDVRFVRRLGRMIVVTYHGDDCRLYGVAQRLFEARGRVGDPTEDAAVADRLSRLGRAAHAALVADLELATYVRPYFERVYVTPLPLLTSSSRRRRGERQSSLVVLHAPSDRRVKGSELIASAVRAAAEEVALEYRELTGVRHGEIVTALADADIAVDQLNSATSGVFALEAMHAGLPVLGEYDRRALAPYQEALPVIAITATTLARELVDLARDPERRSALGAAGTTYVRRLHDPEIVAATMLEIYRHARDSPGGLFEATSAGIRRLDDDAIRLRS